MYSDGVNTFFLNAMGVSRMFVITELMTQQELQRDKQEIIYLHMFLNVNYTENVSYTSHTGYIYNYWEAATEIFTSK